MPSTRPRTKKRKCSNEEDPTNSTDTSSLIPNSQECVDISSNNVLHGKRQRKKDFNEWKIYN